MNTPREEINVSFICDDGYALCTGVAISSLKEKRNPQRQYNVYLISNGVSKENKSLFSEFDEKGFSIRIIEVSGLIDVENAFEMQEFAMHVTQTSLYKFCIPNLLNDIDKVLYLDGDILIFDTLEELYDLDITNYYAAACKDLGAEYYPDHFNKRLGINHSFYFNTGVMLLNLKRMRLEGVAEKLWHYKMNGINHYMDQDAFNVVFHEEVLLFSFLYNMALSSWRGNTNEQLSRFYGIESPNVEYFYNNARILHLSSPEKPWRYYNVVAADDWLVHFIRSPFKCKELNRKAYQKGMSTLKNGCCLDLIQCNDRIHKKQRPIISVIIPVYNAERYLNSCVESLMAQTIDNIQLIFVDDGSTDDSNSILKRYQRIDERIEIIEQKNMFAGIARNNGIHQAKADFLTFLDSDDIMMPSALEHLYKCAKENDADIVISSAFYFCKDENERTVAEYVLREKYLPKDKVFSAKDCGKYLFQITTGAPWGKLFRTGHIRENQLFFLDSPRAEDFYFVFLAMALAKRITVLNEQTVLYRTEEGNGSLEDIKDEYPVINVQNRKKLWDKLSEYNLINELRQSFINSLINGVVYHFRTFRTGTAFESLYKEFVDNTIPLYEINILDRDFFYEESEYNYIRLICEAENCSDFLLREFLKKKKEADKIWIDLKKQTSSYLLKEKEANEIWAELKKQNDALIRKEKEANEIWAELKKQNDALIRKEKEANEIWAELQNQRKECWKLQEEHDELQNEIKKQSDINQNLEKQLTVVKEELDSTRKSASFRLGFLLTWPARKTRNFIRCLKEHGLLYTLKVYFRIHR